MADYSSEIRTDKVSADYQMELILQSSGIAGAVDDDASTSAHDVDSIPSGRAVTRGMSSRATSVKTETTRVARRTSRTSPSPAAPAPSRRAIATPPPRASKRRRTSVGRSARRSGAQRTPSFPPTFATWRTSAGTWLTSTASDQMNCPPASANCLTASIPSMPSSVP